MKKTIATFLAVATVLACLCVGALAADTPKTGIYAVTKEAAYTSTLTLVPQDAAGQTVTSTKVKIDNVDTDAYPGAVRMKVDYSAAASEKNYVVFVSTSSEAALTEANTVYIDQQTVEVSETSVSFAVYPSSLKAGSTYYIYISSDAASGIGAIAKVGSFKCYQTVLYGDADKNGKIEINDAVAIAKYKAKIAVDIDMEAADALYDHVVDIKDAVQIAKYKAKIPVPLGPTE